MHINNVIALFLLISTIYLDFQISSHFAKLEEKQQKKFLCSLRKPLEKTENQNDTLAVFETEDFWLPYQPFVGLWINNDHGQGGKITNIMWEANKFICDVEPVCVTKEAYSIGSAVKMI